MTAKDLKNALLQEAVQGKLVPQIASEGNARDLLNEIRKERLSHGFANSYGICDGKNKKSKSSDLRSKSQIRVTKKELPEITEEEIPFDIPESWCWCRLGEIGNFVRGSGIKRDETTNTGLPCVRYGEMYTTYKIKFSKTKSFTSKDVFEKCHKIHTNDILMALTGENKWDIALAATYEGTEEIAMGGDLCKFTPINCNSLFLVYLINSPYGIEYKRNTSTGDIIVHTSTTKLGNLLIPLPPLSEQKRIVAAIEKFMPLIEEYGKKETQLKAINEKIGTLTKKAILQEAVQGKLVPQIASEGNARDLLEEIRKERLSHGFANSYGICDGKNKKSKSSDLRSKSQIRVTKKELPEITEDEIPFDIPENWCWCRLGDISTFNGGYAFKSGNYVTKENGVRVLRISDFDETGIKEKDPVYYPFNTEMENYKLSVNDIIMCMTGGTVGKSYLVKILNEEMYVNQRVADIKCPGLVDIDYIYSVILSHHIQASIQDNKNSTNDNISAELIRNFIIPLPPLAEQKRIVDAIEKLLPLCEKLGEK